MPTPAVLDALGKTAMIRFGAYWTRQRIEFAHHHQRQPVVADDSKDYVKRTERLTRSQSGTERAEGSMGGRRSEAWLRVGVECGTRLVVPVQGVLSARFSGRVGEKPGSQNAGLRRVWLPWPDRFRPIQHCL